MDPEEFNQLRQLAGKEIHADIVFVPVKRLKEHIVAFDGATVSNSMNLPVVVGGQYNRKTKRLTLYFTLEGRGQICRICVNGAEHGDVGRTHKHELTAAKDCGELPHAVRRADLDGKTPRQVWDIVCRNAHIQHTGSFTDPEKGLS